MRTSDSAIQLGSLMQMEMMGFQNNKGFMLLLNRQSQMDINQNSSTTRGNTGVPPAMEVLMITNRPISFGSA